MWKADNTAIVVICINNCIKIYLRKSIFTKHFIVDLCQGYEYVSGSKYARVLNIPWLHRVLDMSEYTWIIPDYAWLCRNMLDYARICLNIAKSAWIAFVLHVPIVIPCPLEYIFTCFTEVYGLKEQETFLEVTKFYFIYISWKYLIRFLVLG